MSPALKFIVPAVLLVAAAAAARTSTRPAPLRSSDCLDPAQARGWAEGGDDELLVDSGRRLHRLSTHSCRGDSSMVELRFRGDPITGRVCGNIGDRVTGPDGHCRIGRIELIDRDTYTMALGRPRGAVSLKKTIGADENPSR